MKTKLLLTAALICAVSLSAHAGVRMGISFGVPVPRVVVTAPAPNVVEAAPAPVVDAIPACPGPGYVWMPGYWSGYGPDSVWVSGFWSPGPVHFDRDHFDRDHFDRDHFDRDHFRSDHFVNGHPHGGHRR